MSGKRYEVREQFSTANGPWVAIFDRKAGIFVTTPSMTRSWQDDAAFALNFAPAQYLTEAGLEAMKL